MRETERKDLECFLDLLLEVDRSVCEFTDRPDLLISLPDRKVGVEHTRLYLEDPDLKPGQQRRPQEKIHGAIAERARELFRQVLDTPLSVHVRFAEPFDCHRGDIEADAAALSRAVLCILNRLSDRNQPGTFVALEAWEARERAAAYGISGEVQCGLAPNSH